MTAALVNVDAAHYQYGNRLALAGVDLSVQGGILTLLGPNGAGKSTLLRCLATILQTRSGTVQIDGLDANRESERIEIRRRLGYLPQRVGFNAGSTVFDLMDYFAVLKEIGDDRRRRHEVFGALERVGLVGRVGERASSLSGGMQRRLAVAQTLLGSPSLLILDEPSAGLDPDERQRLREITAERRKTTTIIASTHLTDEAALGDTVVVLDEGRVLYCGTPAALAATAQGRVWLQSELPPPNVRASWRQADGRHRCLGSPPPIAELAAATIEDGYLLLTRSDNQRDRADRDITDGV